TVRQRLQGAVQHPAVPNTRWSYRFLFEEGEVHGRRLVPIHARKYPSIAVRWIDGPCREVDIDPRDNIILLFRLLTISFALSVLSTYHTRSVLTSVSTSSS